MPVATKETKRVSQQSPKYVPTRSQQSPKPAKVLINGMVEALIEFTIYESALRSATPLRDCCETVGDIWEIIAILPLQD